MVTLGHFTLDKVWKDKKVLETKDNSSIEKKPEELKSYYEINIDPRWFGNRSVEEIVETLLHEMVHYCNKINEIKDCNGNIHNKKFKTLAEAVGLNVEKGKSVGWGYTSLSDELKKYIQIDIKPNKDAFEYFRDGLVLKPKVKRNKTMFKYTCPKCKQSAKGKKDITIKCGYCDVVMEMEDVNDNEN